MRDNKQYNESTYPAKRPFNCCSSKKERKEEKERRKKGKEKRPEESYWLY